MLLRMCFASLLDRKHHLLQRRPTTSTLGLQEIRVVRLGRLSSAIKKAENPSESRVSIGQ
jgi:hypothetical protein